MVDHDYDRLWLVIESLIDLAIHVLYPKSPKVSKNTRNSKPCHLPATKLQAMLRAKWHWSQRLVVSARPQTKCTNKLHMDLWRTRFPVHPPPPTCPGGSASLCVAWLRDVSRPPEWWQASGLTRDIIEHYWRRLKAELYTCKQQQYKAMEEALRFLGQSIQGCQSQDARKPFSSWRLEMWKLGKSHFCYHRRRWKNYKFPT